MNNRGNNKIDGTLKNRGTVNNGNIRIEETLRNTGQ